MYGNSTAFYKEVEAREKDRGVKFSDAQINQVQTDVDLRQAPAIKKTTTSNAGRVSNLTRNTRTKNYLN